MTRSETSNHGNDHDHDSAKAETKVELKVAADVPAGGDMDARRPLQGARSAGDAVNESVSGAVSDSAWPLVHWEEGGEKRQARWRSEAGLPPPKRIVIADDTMPADQAYRLACEGTALLWRGDFQNARQLLQAMARRIDRKAPRGRDDNDKRSKGSPGGRVSKSGKSLDGAANKAAAASPASASTVASLATPLDAFNHHRLTQAQRARTLGAVLLPLNADYAVPLRRAPDWRAACAEVYGPPAAAPQEIPGVQATARHAPGPAAAPAAAVIAVVADAGDSVVTLRELLGMVGAHEWRKKGVPIAQTGGSIHPHYGVFSPVRGEYVALVADTPLPTALRSAPAFDIGVGTGVLSIVLAKRGVTHIVATDRDPRALACAAENIERHAVTAQVQLVDCDLFPPAETGLAGLIVCNPPWLPAKPSSSIEAAVYDPGSRMLLGFLGGLRDRLRPDGEGWLIMSDFAEHLGLRSATMLRDAIAAAGLTVAGKHDVKPVHPRATDADDPLHAARAAEVTSLWRLRHS